MKANQTLSRSVRVILLCCLFHGALIGQTLPKALILTGNGNVPIQKPEYPPWKHEFQNESVVNILKDVATVEVTEDLNVLTHPQLEEFDLIISNSIFLTPNQEQLEGLYSFVNNGKSYMTLHCGILSLLNWSKYEDFIGGIFIGGPSTVPAEFQVTTANIEFWGYPYSFREQFEHPISLVTEDFMTRDELYYFQPSIRDFHVIARAENLPVMWWHPVGKGKVMSFTLGHDRQAKDNPGYQELLRNGVKWLTGMPLIYAEQPKVVSTRKLKNDEFMLLQGFAAPGSDVPLHFKIGENNGAGLFDVTSTPDGRIALQLKGNPGSGKFVASVQQGQGPPSMKTFDVHIVRDGTGNIASYHGNKATSSSNENDSRVFVANNVIDGQLSTRWSSAAVESAVLTIDLRKEYSVRKLVLLWEASFATDYTIQASRDGRKWTTVVTVSGGDGETDAHELNLTTARYVRVNMTKRSDNKWGYSLYEVEVFGE